jgi:hypothetical protein
MINKYRKKPVEVEAVQLTPLNLEEVERFVGGDVGTDGGEVVIATLEGAMRASIGDFIIRGVKGEFYPCKPDIFEQTYEPSDDERR